MPDEDNNFGGSLVSDFRKWWRHVQPKNSTENKDESISKKINIIIILLLLKGHLLKGHVVKCILCISNQIPKAYIKEDSLSIDMSESWLMGGQGVFSGGLDGGREEG